MTGRAATAARLVDAIVVGGGPNGLAAAIELARAGRSVRVYEAADTVGGGTRSAELTLPGFVHDVCSAAHPLGMASPFFRSVDLARHGVEWAHPDVPVAHALTTTRTVVLERDLSDRGAGLQQALGSDAAAWVRLFGPLAGEWRAAGPGAPAAGLAPAAPPDPDGPFRAAGACSPRRPWRGSPSTGRGPSPVRRHLRARDAAVSDARCRRRSGWCSGSSRTPSAGRWPAGAAGASPTPSRRRPGELGGEIETGRRIDTLDELPAARAVLLDLTPRQVLAVAGDRLPAGYRRQLERYRYGPGVVQAGLGARRPDPVARRRDCARRHRPPGRHARGGRRGRARGRHGRASPNARSCCSPSRRSFDPTRAPAGKHIAWAYCHVPNGSTVDMTERDRGAGRAVRPRLPGPRPGPSRAGTRPRWRRTTPTTSAATSTAASGDLRQLLFRPVVALEPVHDARSGRCSCAPRPRHPAAASTACAASTRPDGGATTATR